jgi:hypothetical protein
MKIFLSSALILFSLNAFAGPRAGELFDRLMSEEPPPDWFSTLVAPAPVDWSQPPLGCVEEMVPHVEPRPCLDLRAVANPMKDWPANLTPAEKDFWYSHRRGLNYCRANELMAREAKQPGSQPADNVELGWMITESVKNTDVKIAAIYEAASQSSVPPHILTGAVYQESLFTELGLSDDGGNFSCGVEQINLHGWCLWANKQSHAEKKAMDWPATAVDCEDSDVVGLELIRPFYDIALTRLNGLPEYRLQASHFQNIPLSAVEAKWPATDPGTLALRYQVIRSFIDNCSDPHRGILAKANELRALYNGLISSAFKNKDRYTGAQRFQRQCQQVPKDNAYPLHTGWLMTVAAYNAGSRAVDAIAFYNRWDRRAFNDPATVKDFASDQLIPSIYWAGTYDGTTDRIDLAKMDGRPMTWTFYTACVAQRHVARVMQQVTLLPEFFVSSLDDGNPCAKSVYDKNGKLVSTSVPVPRQSSSGRK